MRFSHFSKIEFLKNCSNFSKKKFSKKVVFAKTPFLAI